MNTVHCTVYMTRIAFAAFEKVQILFFFSRRDELCLSQMKKWHADARMCSEIRSTRTDEPVWGRF
jgi:hypothetical protein